MERIDKAELSAYQAADLEHNDSSEEHPLLIEMCERFSPKGSESGKGEEKGRTVPAYVVQAVKVVGNLGDGGGYDTLWNISGGPAGCMVYIPYRGRPGILLA